MKKEDIISIITKEMADNLSNSQIELLKNVLKVQLRSYELTKISEKTLEKDTNIRYINAFISSKEVEGCSKRTTKYYKETIEKFVYSIRKSIKDITTADIRKYLADYK